MVVKGVGEINERIVEKWDCQKIITEKNENE
jgi:hypothetical protein